jgi:ribonucleoside-diphosphate reductase alpha chain
MDLWVREARLFKYGSGTGSNFSHLRGEGEKLSGGGKSSGLMSFLKIGDRAAGAIKSGGTTRRAAKMVVVDIDHPDIEDYIDWKVKEEQKVAALVTGSKIVKKHLNGHHEGLRQLRRPTTTPASIPSKNPALKREIKAAKKAMVPENYIKRVHPVRAAGLHRHRVQDLRHRLGFAKPTSPCRARTPTTRSRHRRLPASAVENDARGT